MGRSIVTRIKSWWRTTTPTEKIMLIFGGVSAIGTSICLYGLNHMQVQISFINSKGEKLDLPIAKPGETNTKTLIPSKEPLTHNPLLRDPVESRSQYQQAVDLFNSLDTLNDKIRGCEVTQDQIDDARQKALELAWDLAAKENKLEDAEENLATQLYD